MNYYKEKKHTFIASPFWLVKMEILRLQRGGIHVRMWREEMLERGTVQALWGRTQDRQGVEAPGIWWDLGTWQRTQMSNRDFVLNSASCAVCTVSVSFASPWKVWQNLPCSLLLCEGRFTLGGVVQVLTLAQGQEASVPEGRSHVWVPLEGKCAKVLSSH